MSGPFIVPDVPVYAGDTLTFPPYTFTEDGVVIDLVAEGWGSWQSKWRVTPDAATAITLTVDDSAADEGVIQITATGTQATEMAQSGVFDLQATNSGVVRTWVRGNTSWQNDVTR